MPDAMRLNEREGAFRRGGCAPVVMAPPWTGSTMPRPFRRRAVDDHSNEQVKVPRRRFRSSAILPRRMAKRRRTSSMQRQRASAEALNRRIDQGSGSALPDWRLLLIGGVIVVGVLILALVLIFGGGPAANVGVQQADDGRTHVADGTDCRNDPAQCGTEPVLVGAGGVRAALGTPAAWGVYSSPLAESQSIHNLEHGGIVIWYDPEALTVESIDALTTYVRTRTPPGSAAGTSSS